jgi:SAM-dependent methyltransferase
MLSRVSQTMKPIQDQQSSHYKSDYDYVKGSPHLQHRDLNATLLGWMTETLGRSTRPGTTVLEVGAGDGSMTESILALGHQVVATEMSAASAARLASRFGGNDRFEVIHDPEGNFSALEGRQFDSLLFASVLHHIPDYLETISRLLDSHLTTGGALVSIQDPLWYARVGRPVRFATEASFISWRLTQGELLRGLKTRLRKLRGGPGEEEPGDVVEYHVVRDGVDEQAIAQLLGRRFANVRIETYWSSQGPLQQRIGKRLGLRNTFAVLASGFIR